MSRCNLALYLAATLVGAAGAARAQELPPDKTSIWTLQDENSSISTANLTDKFYTNGLHLGYVSGTDGVPDAMQRVARALWSGGGQFRFAASLNQQIFTPSDTDVPYLPPGDEPYAGLLYGTMSLYRDTPDSRSMIGMSLGLVGPAALGQQLQNGFHLLINQNKAQGWHTQLDNEPLLELTSYRTYRLNLGSIGGLQTQALPNLGFGLGNLMIYGQTGMMLRIGQGLDADYGPPRLFPWNSGGDAFRPTRKFGWYVFLGAEGQGVVRNITLDGNDFSDGPSVKLNPLVGELEAGVAVIVFGTRLTYTQVMQSQTFEHQKGGPHQMGSLALSVRF